MLNWIKNNLFVHRSLGQVLVKNVFWLMSGEAVSRVVRAGVVIYAARILGAASYGAFAFATAIANFLAILSDFGVTPILSREIARDPERKKYHLLHGVLLKAGLLFINVVAVLLIIPQFVTLEESKMLFPLLAVMLVFDSARDLIMAVLRAMERMELEAGVKIFSNLLIAGVGLYFLKVFATSYSLMGAYVIGGGLGFVLALLLLLPFLEKKKVIISRASLRAMLSSSWPLAILALIGTVLLSTDVVMLGWLSSPEEVGFYAAAQRPIILFYMFFGLVGSALFPVIMRLSKEGVLPKLRRIAEVGMRTNLAVALPMVVGGFLLREQIILLLYEIPYLAAISSFTILLFTFIAMVPSGVLTNFIIAYDMQRRFFKFSIFTAIFNILLNFTLVPIFGIVGAACATLSSQILISFFLIRSARKIIRFNPLQKSLKIFLAALIMGGSIVLLQTVVSSVLALIGIGMIIYIAVLLVLREGLVADMFKVMRTN